MQHQERVWLLWVFVLFWGCCEGRRTPEVRAQVKKVFVEVKELIKAKNHEGLRRYFLEGTKQSKDGASAKEFFDGDYWVTLQPGWYLRWEGERVWVYPQDSSGCELWSGLEFELAQEGGRWRFTGRANQYFD